MQSEFFSNNRNNLIKSIGGGVFVLAAYDSLQQQNDMAFPFTQEANFWYLTGIDAPSWRLVIDGQRGHAWLVAPEVDAVHQVFDGSLSYDDAKRISGVNEVITSVEFEPLLRRLASKHSMAYTVGDDPYAKYYDFVINPAPKELANTLSRIFKGVRDCRKDLAKLRAIKQPGELKLIQKAIDLTTKTFEEVRQGFAQFKHEYEVEALFTYRFRQANAVHAYEPIVASGARACTLHSVDNSAKFSPRDMVVIDIGARVGGYAADVTRSYSHNPTKRQQAVHGAVERAQAEVINLIRPNLALVEYRSEVDAIMKNALNELGLLSDAEDDRTYRKYFPHAVSHGLGVDVHDSLGAPRYLEPGMVLTVEPGVYIPEEGIGVRIEDDILVTERGHKNLSGKLATSI